MLYTFPKNICITNDFFGGILFTVKPDKNSASCFITLQLFYFTENYAFYGRFF